jgi:hypothetical protein
MNNFTFNKQSLCIGILCSFLSFSAMIPQVNAGTAKDIQGDMDGNFIVNMDDLVLMSEQWLDAFGCINYPDHCADISGEDGVDFWDFRILARNWQKFEIPLFINEVLASNSQTEPNNNGNYDDWIEIYNASDQAIDLAGMYLTDDMDMPTKWRFPLDRPSDTTVGSKGFILIWADNPDTPAAAGLHASFSLSSEGEEVWLIDTDGQTVIDSLAFAQQVTDVAFGREPDASVQLKTLRPSPGSSNNGSFLGIIEDTTFSHDRGFYTSPFNVTITCLTPGVDIYYTLNGSEPNASDTKYAGPITISQTSCLRAIAMRSGYKSSNVDTHTYIFVSDVLTQSLNGEKPWAQWPNSGTSVNGQLIDYGMDPNIVNDSAYGPLVDDALLAIPSLSIVTGLDNLFDASTGIYVNAIEDGIDWECPISFELIHPDGKTGFQIAAGLRIRGGWSRGDGCPKHSFRLFFRAEYGDSKLKYDLFENEESATEFDKIDLATAQNYSWSFYGDAKNTFMRDVFSRDLQRQMGQPYTRSRFYHLYVNGQYWGLYYTQERSEASYAESYFGGNREDYDVVKADGGLQGTRAVTVTDGTLEEFSNLWNLGNQFDNADVAGKAVLYNRMLGLNPDGSPNLSYPVYLDPDNLIDLMLNVYYVGERDGPISAFFGNTKLNNWYGIFNRNHPDGFKYFRHDAEHSMDRGASDRTGPWTVIDEKINPSFFNPQTLHQWLIKYPEYRMLFADRAYQHMFNGGVMAESSVKAQFDSRVTEIQMAIIAESARWGDAKTHPPRTKADWESAVVGNRNFLTNRVNTLLGHLRNKAWYPSINPPSLLINNTVQYGGNAAAGAALTMSNPNSYGMIYYTLDGSDPRLPGGAVNPAASNFGPSNTVLVPMSAASWKYLYNGSDQGTAWKMTGFDDASWSSGIGQFGFGDGDEKTYIGPNVNGQMSVYFRHRFNVSTVSDITSLSIDLVYDDGAVIYINGQEITRVNMPGGTILFNTAALGGSARNATITVNNIDPSVLSVGDNVIAVEIHQNRADSTDLSFDLRLTATKSSNNVSSIPLSRSTRVKSRVWDGTLWSALADAVFAIGPVAQNLRVSELMYHSAATDPNTEFIELQNISATETIYLNLVEFTKGVEFVFGDTTLSPGQYALIVQNSSAFEAKYPGRNVVGQYTGQLDNGGEEIILRDAIGTKIHDFDYEDGWHELTDGSGFSLTMVNPAGTDPNLWDSRDGWRASLAAGGTPGSVDAVLAAGSIVINELRAHSHDTDPDWIELYNTTGQDINISGWFLSDRNSDDPNIMKYEIPDPTVIGEHSYLVFVESVTFGNPSAPGCHIPFGLSEAGETVYLYSGQSGQVTGYYQTEENFDVSETDMTFGRYEKAELSGGYDFTRMVSPTQGGANSGPQIPAIVITEIYYNPSGVNADDYEFVELYNRSGSAVTLETEVTTETVPGDPDPVHESIPWRLEGTGYEFPAGVTIPSHSYILVAKTPATYTSAPYNLSNVYGPYDGKLDNGGEELEIQIPGDQEYGQARYWIPIEKVDYDDVAPWPTSADGGGHSLQRINVNTYGRDYSNWSAAAPAPGS